MGWENRNGRQYYYRKYRRGKRVFSEYVGNGYQAEIAAAQDSEKRLKESIRKEQFLLMMKDNDDIDNALEEFERLCELLKDATLIYFGFSPHKGEWRKRKHGQF
jgi:hypothetical protein